MKHFFIGMAMIATLSACSVDPQAAADRRQKIKDVLLEPADQQGIELLFPMENNGRLSTFHVTYNPKLVSEPEVIRRIGNICVDQEFNGISIKAEGEPGFSTQPDGTKLPIISMWLKCKR
ncbi:hypothetical protein HCZ23_04350 [Celeribacter sp. HF31]|uniref:hypothetical protein n=1 Tax=Celeribacter sp. HF31 TaxID=2721558 RepID=UPI0014316374|nr:hypothetical protein [Celeribacter sp. HF31]NIY78696.1 hypothetical protein [Celeribacter sp. HF31]